MSVAVSSSNSPFSVPTKIAVFSDCVVLTPLILPAQTNARDFLDLAEKYKNLYKGKNDLNLLNELLTKFKKEIEDKNIIGIAMEEPLVIHSKNLKSEEKLVSKKTNSKPSGEFTTFFQSILDRKSFPDVMKVGEKGDGFFYYWTSDSSCPMEP